MSAEMDRVLPPLREDLRLLPAAPARDGSPRWVIFDPIRHRYFQIGVEAFELLTRWPAGSVKGLAERVKAELGRLVAFADIEALIRFLAANGLTQEPLQQGWRALLEQARAARRSPLNWLIHNYLFIRIPLVRPQRFLDRTGWIVAPLLTRAFAVTIALCAVLALYLVSRQWDVFLATLVSFLSLDGLLLYGALLILVKILHELGHAYTAHRHGCRVPTMGVAFMVLYPVLYTDVTDAWRLRERRKRLAIDIAGVAAELIVATAATLFWVFLPDGAARSVCFVLATTGWIITLAVNLNPFMRFDGYYLLSDSLGVENLGPRSFALARWRLREKLFGIGEPPPEAMAPGLRRTLIAYAFGTWIYRLFLFIGIALLVYAFFFKVLGIVLFTVEILWFVILPVWREVMEWWKMKSRIARSARTWISLSCLLLAVGAVLIPWRGTIVAPALLQAEHEASVFPPVPARLQTIHVAVGQKVEAGAPMFQFQAPDIEYELSRSERRIALLEQRLARRTADVTDLAESLTLEQELEQESETAAGLRAQIDALSVKAPLAGRVVDLDEALRPGLWAGRETRLARIVADDRTEILVALPENVVNRVDIGASGVFVPDDPMRGKIDAKLVDIAPAAQDVVESPHFSSLYGGGVTVEQDRDGRQVVAGSVFGGRLVPDVMEPVESEVRGVVRLEGRPESFARTVWRRVAAVLIRESSF
jgi:putative peptide zinc metalloprotease protein